MNNGIAVRDRGVEGFMINDKRKAVRRTMRYTAWIVLEPGQLHGCALVDVSDTGARLNVENAGNIPDTFTLWLSSNGSARRKCKVIWRAERQIGVAFERAVFDPEQVSLAPNIPVEIVSVETTGAAGIVPDDESIKQP
ncbi:MAG TPA: PilZ domain-containing protein [Pseudolabrys sp.]